MSPELVPSSSRVCTHRWMINAADSPQGILNRQTERHLLFELVAQSSKSFLDMYEQSALTRAFEKAEWRFRLWYTTLRKQTLTIISGGSWCGSVID